MPSGWRTGFRPWGSPTTHGFEVALHEHLADLPSRWKKPQNIFVNSMSDLFHQEVPFDFILRLFQAMNECDWHRFQILTKRSVRLRQLSPNLPWAPHIWMGVTVEAEPYLSRIDDLRETHAQVKFLSLEPLLSPLPGLDLTGIDWVILGGESGPGARPMRRRMGARRSGINAWRRESRSSSSSGEASERRRRVECWTGVPGTKCRRFGQFCPRPFRAPQRPAAE